MADKQSEALKLLREIKNITHLIEELQMQIDEIYSMLTSTTVKPKEVNVQSSGDTDPLATKMGIIIEYQKKIKAYQVELCEKKMSVIDVITQMSIVNQRIITLKYFNGYSIEAIGQKIGYEYRWTWEKIHEAEKEFISIYEKTT